MTVIAHASARPVTISRPGAISKTRALELLDKVVAAKGRDHVYEQVVRGVDDKGNTLFACKYLDGANNPSCLVGHVLVEHGFDPDYIYEFEGLGIDSEMFEDAGIVTLDAANALVLAQNEQDGGGTWGDALELARSTA